MVNTALRPSHWYSCSCWPKGLEQIIEMPLSDDEQAKMETSAKQLKEVMDKAFKETGVKVRQ